ncbi:Protein of unknown function [Gryllus bimaculatus]|nr:Protein of unknown function [Gryllus bimaculatus]
MALSHLAAAAAAARLAVFGELGQLGGHVFGARRPPRGGAGAAGVGAAARAGRWGVGGPWATARRWLPAPPTRGRGADWLLWRRAHIQPPGLRPAVAAKARGYVAGGPQRLRLLYFLFKDTFPKPLMTKVYELFAGNSHRNVQLNSAVPIVMAISRPPLQKHHCVQNIFGSRGHRTNRIARHTSQLQREWAQLTEQLQLLLSGKESAEAQWDEGARRQGQGERVGRMVGEVLEERERERGRWRWSGRGMQWEESERDLKEDLQVLKKRAYRWKSGGGGGDEGERAAAALLAARTPSPSGFSARAVVFRVYAYANMTFRLRGVQVRLVGYFIPLWEEMRKRYNINISITFLNAPDYLTGTVATDAVEQFILKGTIDLVPQYWKFMAIVGGFTHLFDIVSSGENVRYIVLVPYAPPLPAWTLPLSVFSHRIWLSLLGAAVAYALAWRVVAGESLAASAAAALRAFSSCGGAPQDRVRATPQRLQLAAAMLASAVVVVAVYQTHGATINPSVLFYREMEESVSSFQPHLCSRRSHPLWRICAKTRRTARALRRTEGSGAEGRRRTSAAAVHGSGGVRAVLLRRAVVRPPRWSAQAQSLARAGSKHGCDLNTCTYTLELGFLQNINLDIQYVCCKPLSLTFHGERQYLKIITDKAMRILSSCLGRRSHRTGAKDYDSVSKR